MPIPSSIADLSTTASSNSPAGSDSPTEGDNYIRALSAIIKQQSVDLANGTTAASTGDALIAVKRTLTNAEARTLHQLNEEQLVDVWTFIPPGTDTASTDCTTYIQNGLTALSGTGKYLYGVNITTMVTARLSVPTKTGLVSDGTWKITPQNSGFTNVNPDTYETSTSTVVQLTGGTTAPYTANEDQAVIGIKFDGSNIAEGKSCNVIAARNCKNLRIEGNEIYSFKHSKTIIVASLTGRSTVNGNHIHDIESNTVFASHPTFADRGFVNITGIDIDDDAINSVTSDELQVIGNRINNLNHGATAIATYGNQADGIYQNKGNGAVIAYNSITDTSEGIDSLGYDGLIFGNVVRDVTEFGIKLIHGARRNRVSKNRIKNAGLAGIYVGASDVTGNGDTQWNVIEDNVIDVIDPSNLNGGATTSCLKVESTGAGVEAVNNTFRGNYLNPGTYGEYCIVNNSSGDVNNVFDRNDIAAAGADGTYLVLAANNFEITPRVPTRVLAYPSSATAIGTGSMAKFPFDSEQHDTAGEFDTSNNRWVCSVPGFYRFETNATLAACRLLYVAFRKNGSEVAIAPLLDFASDSSASAQLSFVSYMSVADYMEVWIQHGSGSNRNVVAGLANSWFMVSKV